VLAYAPTALGLWIAQDRAQGFAYAQALVGFVLTMWAYLLTRKRLADISIVLFCLAIVFTATAPSALGYSPLKTGPAMLYNRYGYALIALLLVEAVAQWRVLGKRAQFLGGLSSGFLIAITLFLKITFFAGALFLLLALIPCRVQTRSRWLGVAAGFAAIFIPVWAWFGFNLMPMLHDLIEIAGAKHIRLDFYLLDAILQDAGIVAALAVVAALFLVSRHRRQSARTVLIAGIAGSLAGLLLIFGNYEQTGFPLAVFLSIIIIDAANVGVPENRHSPDLFHALVLLSGSALILASLVSGVLADANGIYRKFWTAKWDTAMDSPLLYGFVPVKEDRLYSKYVNDGLALVRAHRRPGDTIMSLDFTNPFSYGLGMRPAPGGTTVLQYRTTFDDTHHQSPRELFGLADLVMMPKHFSDPTLPESIPRLYGPYLETHFHLIGESGIWRLYRRDDTPGQ
jgi:hypothetical protein